MKKRHWHLHSWSVCLEHSYVESGRELTSPHCMGRAWAQELGFPLSVHGVLRRFLRREGQDGLPPSCLPYLLCPPSSLLLLHLFSHHPPSSLPRLAPAVLCSSQFYPGLGVVQGHRSTFGGNSSLSTGRANLPLWP